MMKRWITGLLALTLCAALLALPAAAAETEEETSARPGPVLLEGPVTWMDEDTFLLENENPDNPNREVVVHLGDAPMLDASTGAPLTRDQVADGDVLRVWVGPAMALSLPPQATAQVVLGNLPADGSAPDYYVLDAVKPQAMLAINPPPALTWTEVTATDGTVLHITDEVSLTPYLTRNIVRLEDLIPGARILVWSDSQGQPERVTVFPYEYRGYLTVSEKTVSVNGSVVSRDFKSTEDGDTLLPIRAVAEALGMNVAWEAGKGAVVSYGDDMVKPAPLESETLMTALPGGAITAVSSDGETEELAGTCLKENGVTYVSWYALAQALDLYVTG